MRVVYHYILMPIACVDGEFESKVGLKSSFYGGSQFLDRKNGKRDGLASSCILMRTVHAYEYGIWGPLSMRRCRDRGAIQNPNIIHSGSTGQQGSQTITMLSDAQPLGASDEVVVQWSISIVKPREPKLWVFRPHF